MTREDFDRVLIACHRNPDGDTIGSAFALAHALRLMKKSARVYCPDPFPEDFAAITSENGRDFEPERYIAVDCASAEMLDGAPFADALSAVIDHHRVSTLAAPYKYVDERSAACGEIVYELIRRLPVQPDEYIAKALYCALATDTGCFRYTNTTPRTHRIAAKLLEIADRDEIADLVKRLFETKSRRRMALEAFAAEKARFLFEGKAAFLTVTLEDQKRFDVSYADLDPLIDVIRQVEGVKVALCVKERQENEFKVSVRADRGFDACAFCAVFGGGGHIAAAGCTIRGTKEETEQKLITVLEERFS